MASVTNPFDLLLDEKDTQKSSFKHKSTKTAQSQASSSSSSTGGSNSSRRRKANKAKNTVETATASDLPKEEPGSNPGDTENLTELSESLFSRLQTGTNQGEANRTDLDSSEALTPNLSSLVAAAISENNFEEERRKQAALLTAVEIFDVKIGGDGYGGVNIDSEIYPLDNGASAEGFSVPAKNRKNKKSKSLVKDVQEAKQAPIEVDPSIELTKKKEDAVKREIIHLEAAVERVKNDTSERLLLWEKWCRRAEGDASWKEIFMRSNVLEQAVVGCLLTPLSSQLEKDKLQKFLGCFLPHVPPSHLRVLSQVLFDLSNELHPYNFDTEVGLKKMGGEIPKHSSSSASALLKSTAIQMFSLILSYLKSVRGDGDGWVLRRIASSCTESEEGRTRLAALEEEVSRLELQLHSVGTAGSAERESGKDSRASLSSELLSASESKLSLLLNPLLPPSLQSDERGKKEAKRGGAKGEREKRGIAKSEGETQATAGSSLGESPEMFILESEKLGLQAVEKIRNLSSAILKIGSAEGRERKGRAGELTEKPREEAREPERRGVGAKKRLDEEKVETSLLSSQKEAALERLEEEISGLQETEREMERQVQELEMSLFTLRREKQKLEERRREKEAALAEEIEKEKKECEGGEGGGEGKKGEGGGKPYDAKESEGRKGEREGQSSHAVSSSPLSSSLSVSPPPSLPPTLSTDQLLSSLLALESLLIQPLSLGFSSSLTVHGEKAGEGERMGEKVLRVVTESLVRHLHALLTHVVAQEQLLKDLAPRFEFSFNKLEKMRAERSGLLSKGKKDMALSLSKPLQAVEKMFQARLSELSSLASEVERVENSLHQPLLRSAIALIPPSHPLLPSLHLLLSQLAVHVQQVRASHSLLISSPSQFVLSLSSSPDSSSSVSPSIPNNTSSVTHPPKTHSHGHAGAHSGVGASVTHPSNSSSSIVPPSVVSTTTVTPLPAPNAWARAPPPLGPSSLLPPS